MKDIDKVIASEWFVFKIIYVRPEKLFVHRLLLLRCLFHQTAVIFVQWKRGEIVVVKFLWCLFSGGLDLGPSLFFISSMRPGLKGHPFNHRA